MLDKLKNIQASSVARGPKTGQLPVRWLERETATVAVGDVSNTLDSVAALAGSSLRAVVFHEVLGWDPARADAALAEADARAAGAAGVRIRLAAHAPHSVSPALFAK